MVCVQRSRHGQLGYCFPHSEPQPSHTPQPVHHSTRTHRVQFEPHARKCRVPRSWNATGVGVRRVRVTRIPVTRVMVGGGRGSSSPGVGGRGTAKLHSRMNRAQAFRRLIDQHPDQPNEKPTSDQILRDFAKPPHHTRLSLRVRAHPTPTNRPRGPTSQPSHTPMPPASVRVRATQHLRT